jgi:hypothetical protein
VWPRERHASRSSWERAPTTCGNVAAEPRIVGPIDLAHAAGAERCNDIVWTETRSRGERYSGNLAQGALVTNWLDAHEFGRITLPS